MKYFRIKCLMHLIIALALIIVLMILFTGIFYGKHKNAKLQFLHEIKSFRLNNLHGNNSASEERNFAKLHVKNNQIDIQQIHIPKVYRKDHLLLEKYLTYLNHWEEPLPLQTKAVIIFADYRSGSSFFGELFNQHPDIFYVFEPLILVSSLFKCMDNILHKKEILQNLSQCIIPDWNKIYNEINPKPRSSQMNLHTLYSCTKKRFCFAPFTKELMSEKHCVLPTLQKIEHDPWKDCGVVNTNLAANECRKKKFVAIKVIRACDIQDFEEIVTKTHVDLRVIQLLRDPRGIANSRSMLHKRISLSDSSNFTCNRQLRNLKLGLLNTPYWLRGKYKVFRFEDLALDPIKTAHELYRFLGLNFPNSVKEWILNNTCAENSFDSASNVEEADKSQMREKKTKCEPVVDPWSRTRNSKSVILQWQQRLSFSQVQEIQEQCRGVMKLAGYVPVEDSNHYSPNNSYLL